MKHYRKELWFDTKKRREFINITPLVQKYLEESGIREGLLLCNAMHIFKGNLTAAAGNGYW